jgi:superfamily I DNA and/or RNA helicase
MDEDLLARDDILEIHRLTIADVEETLFKRLAERLPASNQFELRQQRRMIAPIGDLISHCFYDGRLDSPNSQGLPGYELLGRPVTWLNTSTAPNRHEDSGTADCGQYVNRLEADVVADRLRRIDNAIDAGIIRQPTGDRLVEILVLAPYRSQVDHLRRRLAREQHANLSVTVDTIDAVQGRESDLAILSVTRSNIQGRMGFLGNAYWRRINVALSRARFGLTIVGDFRFCERGGLSRVVSYIKQHPKTCEVRAVNG